MDELSTLSTAAADAVASEARDTAARADEISGRVAVAVDRLGGWYGLARDGFGDRAAELTGHLETLTFTAAAGAAVIASYSAELGMLQRRLTGIDTALAAVQARVDAGVGDLTTFHADWAELDHWQASRRAVLAAFDDLTESFATRLFAVLDQVADRPRRLGEHVDDAARTLADSARDSAYLAAGWAWDAPGWTSAVRQVPAALLDSAVHPVRTLADAVDWDDWSRGRYGAGVATLGTAVVGRGVSRGGRLGKVLPEGHRWAKHLDADGNPLPQSVEELYAGVDLGRSEVFAGAHTLGRHVEVDDEFLERRLLTGDLGDGGSAKKPPPVASRFTDQVTAEEVITAALRSQAEKINHDIDDGFPRSEVIAPAPVEAGVAWARGVDGTFVNVPVAQVRILLAEADDGSWYVKTAYLEGAG